MVISRGRQKLLPCPKPNVGAVLSKVRVLIKRHSDILRSLPKRTLTNAIEKIMAKSPIKKNSEKSDSLVTNSKITSKSNVAVLPLKINQPELSNGDFGKLQDLLFGKQMAVHTNQLLSLHNHVESRINNLQNICEQQYADLHVKLEEGLLKINQTIEKNNQKQNTDTVKTNNSLESTSSRLMKQLKQDSDEHAKVQDYLKSQLNESREQLTTSIQKNHDEIIERLESAIADLQSQKLDKGALSSLLGDVATQLTGVKHK